MIGCVLKLRAEAVEDVYTSRKKQHQTMMHYFCSLNTLQYKKKMALLEPLLGYMQAQVNSNRWTCMPSHFYPVHPACLLRAVVKSANVLSSWPVCSVQISFFRLGSENLTQQWEDFLGTIGTSVQK